MCGVTGLAINQFPISKKTPYQLLNWLYKFVLLLSMKEHSFASYHCPHEMSLGFFSLAIVTGVRRNVKVILVCISLTVKNVEHFFQCFLDICSSHADNALYRSVPNF